jgi:hypothetical protein
MKHVPFAIGVLFLVISGCSVNKLSEGTKEGLVITPRVQEKRVDVSFSGRLFTSLQWPDSVFKPVLYPLINSSGTEVTRGFPLNPRAGERSDHPHHVGMWFNYGNVNGIDFWGNSLDIPLETRDRTGGVIRYLRSSVSNNAQGNPSLTVFSSWLDPSGKELLSEKTTFNFREEGNLRIIDRLTILQATNGNVKLADTKEGMFAIRVARQLELPSQEAVTLTDAAGNPTKIPKLSNEDVTGNYLSSEGVMGDSVWGKKARWMNLYGVIDNDSVSLVICDHPDNPGYPTYWHARGYGLFSVNPFGAKDFTNGASEMNFEIKAGDTAEFRYRFIVSSRKHLQTGEINRLADEFASKY